MARMPQDKEEHVHDWNANICFGCGAIQMTYAEFGKQKAEWDVYYDAVKTTEAYQNFQSQLRALRKRDELAFKLCVEKARGLMEEQVWLPKPELPDPVVLRAHKKLVIID